MTELEKREAAATEVRPDLDLLQVALLVLHRKKLFTRVLLGTIVVSSIIAWLLPNRYVSTARILPPSSGSSLSSMLMAQFSSLGGAGTSSILGNALNLKNSSDVYVAMLKSRTIQDEVIKKHDLLKVYGVRTFVEGRKKLSDSTEITSGKEGVIVLDFEDKDPNRARDIAQTYVDTLLELSQNLAVTEAGQRRVFFQRELQKEKDNLATAEVELKQVQQRTGLIVPGEQARATVDAIARLQAMAAAKQVEIGAMRSFATETNPQLQQSQRQLQEIQAQLQKLERRQGPTQDSDGDIFLPTGILPEKALEYVRSYRDFKYHEALYEMLAKQFETAKIEEARDYAALQVLEVPVVADRKSKPYRLVIVGLSALAVLFILISGVIIEHMHSIRMRSPEYAARFARFRTHLRRAV